MPLDSLQLIRDEQKNLLATQEGVSRARTAYETIAKEIKNAQARYRRKVSEEHGEVTARKAIESIKAGNVIETILINQITIAATGTEFEKDVYLSKMLEVANHKDVYKLIPIGAGWNSKISTQIVFEEDAGRLEDYARGIRAYRASLKTKQGGEGSKRGIKATEWWLTHVYGSTLEDRTVEGRVGVSGRPAPFWKILDAGSTPLPSDRKDSSYNPLIQKPTGFIKNAEDDINKEFITVFTKLKAEEFEEANLLQAEIDNAKTVREGMKNDLSHLSTDYKRNRQVLDSLGAKSAYADEDKLAKLIQRIDNNEKLPARASIGRKGTNLTISVKKLQGLLEY